MHPLKLKVLKDDYLSSSDAQDELLKIHESALETVLIKEALDEALESV